MRPTARCRGRWPAPSGAAGGAESYLSLVPHLRKHFRMVMVEYPLVGELVVLCDGLAAILDAEGVERVESLIDVPV